MKISKLYMRGYKIIRLTSFDTTFRPFILINNN